MKNIKTLSIFFIALLITAFVSANFVVTTTNVSVSVLDNFSEEKQTTDTSDNFIISRHTVNRDFTILSNNRIVNMCSCSAFVDTLSLVNTGNVEDTYKLSTDKDYSRLTSHLITLAPGQSVGILNYITPGCREIDDQMSIFVESGNGNKKELVQEINVVTCSNINITPVNSMINTTPCMLETAKFVLNNPLDFSESYYIDTNVLPAYSKISQNPITIPQKQSREVIIYFEPDCGVYGKSEGEIKVVTKNTKLISDIPIIIDIKRKYDYDVLIPDNEESCNYLQTRIPITIRNYENFENTYALSIKRSKWFSLENKTVVVGPNSQETVYLHSHPGWREVSPVDMIVNVVSKLGGIEKEVYFAINISDCYKFKLSHASDYNICSDDNILHFNLMNTGTYDDVIFKLNTTNKIFSIEDDTVVLDSGQSMMIPVKINATDNTKSYKGKITAKALDGYFIQKLPFKLNVKSLHDCYLAGIDVPYNIKTNYSFDIHNLTIKNNGMNQANYKITLEENPLSQIFDNRVILKPGEEESINVYIDPPKNASEGRYKAKLMVVEQSSNATYEKDFMIILRNKTILQKISDYFKKKKKNETVDINISCIELYDESICNSKYHIVIGDGEELTLNLSEYVNEPDNQSITFTILNESDNNKGYKFSDGELKLQLKENFTGFYTFHIVATDTENKSTKSPLFIVEITNDQISGQSFIQVLFTFISLLLVLVYIIVRTDIAKKERRKKVIVKTSKKIVKRKK